MHEMTTDVAVVGAGPAGLMAAQELALAGWSVHLFDAMPSVGRKFLLAGKGAEPDPFRAPGSFHAALRRT
jgi:predicted flavoprotein YhiN